MIVNFILKVLIKKMASDSDKALIRALIKIRKVSKIDTKFILKCILSSIKKNNAVFNDVHKNSLTRMMKK